MKKIFKGLITTIIGAMTIGLFFGYIYLIVKFDYLMIGIGLIAILFLSYGVGLCVMHAWKESDMREKIYSRKKRG